MNCRALAARLKTILAIFFALALLAVQPVTAQTSQSKPKNIIILFADGTTASQYEFGRYSSLLLRNQAFAITDIVMKKGQIQLMNTESANYFVTDSAAAASAMSTGFKVNNGSISVLPDGRKPTTLMQFAKNSVAQGFLNDWQMDLIRSGTEPIALLQELVQAAGFSPEPKLAAL